MANIYITGHKNPDLDSVCSAYALSVLKNTIDKDNKYIPVTLGPVNKNTKAVFNSLNISIPMLLRDVRATVKDVYRTPTLILDPNDPVYTLVKMYNQSNPSVVPIIDKEGVYHGLLSVDDINRYFLSEGRVKRQCYNFRVDNIPRVLPGYYIKEGEEKSFSAPLMIGAMRFDVFKERVTECAVMPMLIVGCRRNHIDFAIKHNLPGLILTGVSKETLEELDFSKYKGLVYVSFEDTAETIRLLRQAISVMDMADINVEKAEIFLSTRFDTAKDMLIESQKRGLSVFDEEQKWVGFITRRCFLNRPRQKMILVDHNEASQSVTGLDEADIIEIIDHHRLDAPKTRNPISIIAEPVGSTCTIVAELFDKYHIPLSKEVSTLLLAGLLADTLILKSPTTTFTDRKICEMLMLFSGIKDFEEFGKIIFAHSATLCLGSADELIRSDFKKYKESGVSFGIGQVEVTTLRDAKDVSVDFVETLKSVAKSENLDWAMLLVTDVLTQKSVLFTTPFEKTYKFLYDELSQGVYDLPGVLSRKKQLLPEIIRILEG